ncbi:MAG: hypothetical protein Q7S40_30065 [Opitutaceae bacterium]|nr:hypothetical protein [Opitutaceae bacterium]
MDAGEFLVVNDRLQDAGAATAVLFGPIDSGPSAGGELFEPRYVPLPLAFVFHQNAEAFVLALGLVVVKPGAEFRAKLFVFGGEVKIHPCFSPCKPETPAHLQRSADFVTPEFA